jgi:hypothetical protein
MATANSAGLIGHITLVLFWIGRLVATLMRASVESISA